MKHCDYCGQKLKWEWRREMMDKFTKADLKDGMVIETRERGRYLVLGDRVVREEGFDKLV